MCRAKDSTNIQVDVPPNRDQENPSDLFQGIADGWSPDVRCCGAGARELLGNMSFKGRQNAPLVIRSVQADMDALRQQCNMSVR